LREGIINTKSYKLLTEKEGGHEDDVNDFKDEIKEKYL